MGKVLTKTATQQPEGQKLEKFSAKRFVDEDATAEISKSPNINLSMVLDKSSKPRSYYNGDFVTERMNRVRETINYIRQHWDEYDSFMDSLREYALNHGYSLDKNYRGIIGSQLFHRRDWSKDIETCGFEVIKLYTANEAYVSLFSSVYSLFRTDNTTDVPTLITVAVFLVELINIELFNLVLKVPQKSNYEGTVYRGLTVTGEELENIKNLTTGSIDKRYISIPLALNSSTKDPLVSLGFIIDSLDRYPDKVPLLYRIHVINCDQVLLAEYHKRFPKSVVSSICAVDIEDISVYPQEKEVLLRGPFLQLIKPRDETLDGRKVTVLDCVMVNSSRDHWVTAHLGDDDTPARIHFGVIVGITRARFCIDLAKQYGYDEDMKMFETKLAELQEKLEGIRNSNN